MSIPPELKLLQPYLRTAHDFQARDPVVSYYCSLYAIQEGLRTGGNKQPAGKAFLLNLMDNLEEIKKRLSDNEAITSEIVGQAHVEDKALKLFVYADTEDRAAKFGMNVVKSFYTASILFDVLKQFGEVSPEIVAQQKYAKWKATYIRNCLKTGEIPIAGPMPKNDEDEDVTPAFLSNPMPPPSSGLGYGNENSTEIGFSGFEKPAAVEPPQLPISTLPSSYGYPSVNAHASVDNKISQPAPDASASGTTGATPQPVPSGYLPYDSKRSERVAKLCKFTTSALNYEDVKTAVDCLTKALNLLTTGKEEPS
jgi:vacuolar protein sorting-associated protein VTA1